MVILKGSLTKQYSPQGAEDAEVTFYCFPLRGRKTNNNMPSPTKIVVHKSVLMRAVRSFLFWPLTRKEKTFSLCELCVLSEAGGKKHYIIYPHSKTGQDVNNTCCLCQLGVPAGNSHERGIA